MNLDELFPHEVVSAPPEQSIGDVARLMERRNVGAVVLVDASNHVTGMVTDRDVALALATQGVTPQTPVDQIMSTDVKTIWRDEGLFNATQYFLGHRVRRLPIVDRSDQLCGLVSVDDVFALLAREFINVARALEPALGERV